MKNLFAILISLITGMAIGYALSPAASNIPIQVEQDDLRLEIQHLQHQLAEQKHRNTQLEQKTQAVASKPEGTQKEKHSPLLSQPEEINTPDEEQTVTLALQKLGLDSAELKQIADQIDVIQLARLNLRHQALREEWYGTERYYSALRQQNNEHTVYRAALGEKRYDTFLFLTGSPNRVGVRSVMKGSVAEQIGILPQDMVVSYAEQKIYDWAQLSQATTQGSPEEQVRIELHRNGEVIHVYAPRGPLGLTLTALSVQP